MPLSATLTPVQRPPHQAQRVVAVDVMRGLVMLLLLPDQFCAFSVCKMAHLEPGNQVWGTLSRWFTHVPWAGSSVWDLVMPVFVFVVGVSMALSFEARRRAGIPWAHLFLHAVTRSAMLATLGVMLMYGIRNRVDEALPFLLLAAGLPLYRWWCRLTGRTAPTDMSRPDAVIGLTAVALAWTWMLTHPEGLINLELLQILLLIGLAYVPAFLMLRYDWRIQALAAAGVLVLYAAIFIAYPAPADIGLLHDAPRGFLAHWENGSNAAAAFDRWLLNLLPRSEPYTGNWHGYHTLQFVPLIAMILAGAVVGRLLTSGDFTRSSHRKLGLAGLAGLVLSWLLTTTVSPLVKSLWTPSWAVFSTSVALLLLAALARCFDQGRRDWLARPLAILGSNALLLYVISFNERWRIVGVWTAAFGERLTAASLRPVIESGLVIVTLWLVAYALHRSRIYVRF